jgi:putative ATP-dependent endonuclease of OLD family
MKLRYFKAQRFRSLKEFELNVDDFLVLIGENNHGKSNIFYALDLLLSSTVRGVNSDFFYKYVTDNPIILTSRFEDLTTEEMEKLEPWTVDRTLTISKEYFLDSAGKVTVNYYALMEEPEDEWLSEDFEDYSNRGTIAPLPISEFIPPSGKITKLIYKQAIEQYKVKYGNKIRYKTEHRKNPAGYKQVLDGYLPEFYLVPAVRDVTDETKTTSASTLLSKVLNVVVRRIARQNPAFQDLQQAVQNIKKLIEGESPDQKIIEIRELEQRISKELALWDIKVAIDVNAPDVERVFQLGTSVTLDDGFKTDISQKGHGLQRSLLFALMRVWAEETRKHQTEESGGLRERANIFAFEEPELFLHPQVARATYEALKQVSEIDQVLLCSHSPHCINLEDYRCIVIVRKKSMEEGSKCFRVSQDLFEGDSDKKKRFNMIRFFNPDRNELFFARKVVLVEGPTEKAALPAIARRVECFDHRVSVIDCGSKFNLTLYMMVLNAFKIPYLVIHDEDPIDPELDIGGSRHDVEKLRGAKKVYEESRNIEVTIDPNIGKIEVIKPEFENLLGISETHAKKVGKPYAAIERIEDETKSIPSELEGLVREAYS